MSFWKELKRRNVYKVGVAYAIVAWLLIQFAAIAFPHLSFPSWAVLFVIVIFIIGFPLALLLAWAYEVTPEGIKRTKEVPLAESITHLTGKKLNYILAGVIVLAIAYIVIDKFYLDRRAMVAEQAPVASNVQKVKKTIAVLPFVNLSSDPEQEYFVDGLSEELINCLTKISDLHVTSRTSSFTFKNSDKTIQEIAEILGREYILEGSVRKVGNALKITAQLIRAEDDRHLWSETYNKELKDIYAVQEDIANSVADKLKLTLESLKLLGGTENIKAYELYLVAQGQKNAGEYDLALKSIDEAIEIDHEFALAWAYKGIIHTFLMIFGPVDRLDTERYAAQSAAQRAIEIEPHIANSYVVLGFTSEYTGSVEDLIKTESYYLKALELKKESLSGDVGHIVRHYGIVGNFKKAHEILEQVKRNDPLNKDIRASYMENLANLGDIKAAEDEYERCKTIFGSQWPLGDAAITTIRIGTNMVSRDKIVYSDKIYDAAREHLDSPKEGLAELRRIYTDDDNLTGQDLCNIALLAAYFGEPEFAMVAFEKSGILGNIWSPVMHEVRQFPQFRKYVKWIGLMDYWNEFGWPDICHQLDNGDFECE